MGFFRRIFGNQTDEADNEQTASNTGDDSQERPLIDTSQVFDPLADEEAVDDAPSDDKRTTQPIPASQTEASEGYEGADSDEQVVSLEDIDAKLVEVNEDPLPIVPGATRPLPKEPNNTFEPQQGHLIFGQTSDQGMVRTNNQDAAFSFFTTSISAESYPDFGLFVVADGMGGHHDGEKASTITARTIAHNVMRDIYLPMLEYGSLNHADTPPIAEALTAAVKQANRDVLDVVPDGGTTVTSIVIVGNLIYTAHVGDSRAYLITDNGLEQITRDHSLVQRLIELNHITVEESMEHPQRNVLYRAVGQNMEVDVDTLTRRIPPGSHLLICSDGLWSYVPEDELLATVRAHNNPQEACDKLVAIANHNGGHDNITAILITMPTK